MLIEPEMLATLINDEGLILIDARYSLADSGQGYEMYRQGHISGAVYADLGRDLSGPVVPGQTGRHPLPSRGEFEQTLRRWGVCSDSSLVVYDDGSHAMAARAWWLLRWAGLKKVRILHGGMKSWQACRYPLCVDLPARQAGHVQMANPAMAVVSADEILAGLDESQFALVDARARERFAGEVEPLDTRGGHIPGAVCHPFAENLDDQGRFFAPEYLRNLFSALVGDQKPIVVYCGSGVTACHTIFAMEYAGLRGVSLYPGSWSEWITIPQRPVAKGDS